MRAGMVLLLWCCAASTAAVTLDAVAAPPANAASQVFVFGVVTDANGPVSGICVQTFAGDIGIVSTSTAANGTYSLSLPTGRPGFIVEFNRYSAETFPSVGCGYNPAYPGDVYFLSGTPGGTPDSTQATVVPGNGGSGVSVTLPDPATISGTVTSSSGALGGICVTASTPFAPFIPSVTSALDGTYSLTGLYPGVAYDVEFNHPGGFTIADPDNECPVNPAYPDVFYRAGTAGGTTDAANATAVNAPSTGIDVVLGQSTITGKVLAGAGSLTGVSGICVVAADGGTRITATTGSDGGYTLTGVFTDRTYSVEFNVPDCTGSANASVPTHVFYRASSPLGTTNAGEATGVAGGASAINVILAAGIAGTVRSATGPVSGICVANFVIPQSATRSTTTNADGVYTLTGLTAGTSYRMVFNSPFCTGLINPNYPQFVFYASGTPGGSEGSSVATPVTSPSTGIDVTLGSPATISGTVTDASVGVSGLHVSALPVLGGFIVTTTTGLGGTYTLNNLQPGGSYYVRFNSNSSGPANPAYPTNVYFKSGTPEGTATQSQATVLNPNPSQTGVDWRLNQTLAPQTITMASSASTSLDQSGIYQVIATTNDTDSDAAIVLSIDGAANTAGCSINATGFVSFTDAGTCTINANAAATANFSAAPQVQQVLTVAGSCPAPPGPSQFGGTTSGGVSDDGPVGTLDLVIDDASVVRADGTRVVATPGMPIFQGDVIETSTGIVGVQFKDGTRFSMQPSARLSVDSLEYDCDKHLGAAFFELLQGVFEYTSGLIGKSDPDSVNMETPVGAIGIRGTKFIARVYPELDFLQIDLLQGEIDVDPSLGTTTTTMDAPETGAFNSSDVIRTAPLTEAQVELLEAQLASEHRPDLTATATNDVSGSTLVAGPWTWKVHVANDGDASAQFGLGPDSTVLLDQLPASGVAYGTPVVGNVTGTTGTVTCAIDGAANLTCTASDPVEISPDGSFDVTFTATPLTAGEFANPRVGGICAADPYGENVESNATANACSDTVAASYQVRLLDQSPERGGHGNTLPIRVQLLDANGTNVSSRGIVLTLAAPSVTPSPDPGAQPSGRFRFVAKSADGPMYRYRLKDTRYPTGAYTLSFTATGDPVTHSVQFVVGSPLLTGIITDLAGCAAPHCQHAVKKLVEALQPGLWAADGVHLAVPEGEEVFGKFREAVDELDKVPGDATADHAISALWDLALGIANDAIADAQNDGGKPAEINAAMRERDKALTRWTTGHNDALEHLRQAWKHAQNAES